VTCDHVCELNHRQELSLRILRGMDRTIRSSAHLFDADDEVRQGCAGSHADCIDIGRETSRQPHQICTGGDACVSREAIVFMQVTLRHTFTFFWRPVRSKTSVGCPKTTWKEDPKSETDREVPQRSGARLSYDGEQRWRMRGDRVVFLGGQGNWQARAEAQGLHLSMKLWRHSVPGRTSTAVLLFLRARLRRCDGARRGACSQTAIFSAGLAPN